MLADFDHEWFKEEYGINDCTDRNKLFQIYQNLLKTIPASPNVGFNEAYYLNMYPDVKNAVKAGKFSSGFEHYVLMGKKESRVCNGENPAQAGVEGDAKQIKLLFDESWYLHTYPLAAAEIAKKGMEPFEYYITRGIEQRHSPNNWFDEEWYLSFYPDVLDLIETGLARGGFDHYLRSGRGEYRLPRRKVKDILEYKFPGLTQLAGLERAAQLERKLQPMPVEAVLRSRIRINFVVPTMDKDIMFGGYAAILQLIRKVVSMGLDTRILVTEDAHLSKEYAWMHNRLILDQGQKSEVEFENVTLRDKRIKVSSNDRFVAYSAWTALIASDLAACTDEKKFIFLIQEDERIFHHNDSIRAIVEYAYSLPHVALFNSHELMQHFKSIKLGIFDNDASNSQNTFAFEHVLTPVSLPTESALTNKAGKKLLFYGRPEPHAARNIFELGFLGLKEAIRRGHFDRTWSFDAVGTLVEKRTVEIGDGIILNMMPKLDGGSYGSLLANYDIGLSLMYAPHPGLVHFEMAAAGMIVVANEYEQRNEQYFKDKSDNFVVTKPTIHGIAEALGKAAQRANNIPARVQHAYKPKGPGNWDQVFSNDLVARLLSAISVKPV